MLDRFGERILSGFTDLEKFELIDRLEKPLLHFIFYGNKKKILEVDEFLAQFPYAYVITTKKGRDIWGLPNAGSRNAFVHISRFPKLLKFVMEHESNIPDDLWGLLYGYPLPEVHQFTYDWEAWNAMMAQRTEGEENVP